MKIESIILNNQKLRTVLKILNTVKLSQCIYTVQKKNFNIKVLLLKKCLKVTLMKYGRSQISNEYTPSNWLSSQSVWWALTMSAYNASSFQEVLKIKHL